MLNKKTVQIFLFIILSLVNIPLLMAGKTSQKLTDEIAINREFSALCASFKNQDLQKRVPALLGFIEDYPNYILAYERLRNEIFWHSEKQLAYIVFNRLIENEKTSAGGYWLLAQLERLSDNYEKADDYYQQAVMRQLHADSFLSDFADYYLYSKELRKRLSLIGIKKTIPDNYDKFSAFFLYKKQDYARLEKHLYYLEREGKNTDSCYYIRGLLHSLRAQYPQARACWNALISQAKNTKNKYKQAQAYLNLIASQYDSKDFTKSLVYADSARSLAQELSDPYLSAKSEIMLGDIYNRTNNYSKTLVSSDSLLPNFKMNHDYRLLIIFYSCLSSANNRIGNYIDALKAVQKAEIYEQKCGSSELGFYLQFQKGQIYEKLKQFEQAKQIFRTIQKKLISDGDTYYRYGCLKELGDIMLHEQQYQPARNNFKKALPYYESLNYYVWGRIARSYFLEKNYSTAEQYYVKAHVATPQGDMMIPWYDLRQGEVALELEKFDIAAMKLQAALKSGLEKDDMELLWEVYFAIGRLNFRQQNFSEAINAYRHAIVYIEKVRKKLKLDQFRIGYFIEPNAVYEHLAEAYLQRFQAEMNPADRDSLFHYSSLTRSRSLQQATADRHNKTSFLRESEAAKPYRQLQQQVAMQQRKLRTLPDSADEQADSIYQSLQILRLDMLAQKLRALESRDEKIPAIQKMKDIFLAPEKVGRKLAQNNQALLHYHISDRQSFVVAITPRETAVIPLTVRADSLEKQADKLLLPFYNVTEENIDSTIFHADIAHQLYQQLLQPVVSQIALPEKLIIIPDFHLASLPFDLLLLDRAQKSSYTNQDSADYAANLLLNKYIISYSPAVKTVLQDFPALQADSALLVIANPTNDESEYRQATRSGLRYQIAPFGKLVSLPNATIEAKKLDKLKVSVKVLRHGEGTEAALFKHYRDYKILHFASHGIVDTVFDAFSAVALALDPDDSTSDGLLMGYEIEGMDLNCDLITLGACETGRGRAVHGEGVLGLPRIVLSGGARSVIQTLWKIDDEPASMMMPLFYHNYLIEKMDKAEALTVAKRQLLRQNKKYAHPFYWAAFTLYGDTGHSENDGASFESLAKIIVLCLLILVISILVFRRIRNRRVG